MDRELARSLAYGAAVGDALGVPYEFMACGTFECTGMVGGEFHGQPAGTWSDDTALLLATMASLKELGRVDAADMLRRFRSWLTGGEYAVGGVVFDVGNATATALREGRGRTDVRSNGNGSLMRILPLALTTCS